MTVKELHEELKQFGENIRSKNFCIMLNDEKREFILDIKTESPNRIVITEDTTFRSLNELYDLVGSKVTLSFVYEDTAAIVYLGEIVLAYTYIRNDGRQVIEYVIHYIDIKFLH